MKASLTKKQILFIIFGFLLLLVSLVVVFFLFSSKSLDDRAKSHSTDPIRICSDEENPDEDECLPPPPVCGSYHERVFSGSVKAWPEGRFCTSGVPNPTAPVFPDSGAKIEWQCVGLDDRTVDCWAEREKVEEPTPPDCGDLDGSKFPYDTESWPSEDFCKAGDVDPESPNFPSKGGKTTWECVGEDETKVSCEAIRDNDPVRPTPPDCGDLDGSKFPHTTERWPSNNFCAVGSANPPNPLFPEKGGSITWECIGEGNEKVSCNASRNNEPATPPVTPPPAPTPAPEPELPETSVLHFVSFFVGITCLVISFVILSQKHDINILENASSATRDIKPEKISMKIKVNPKFKKK